MTLSIDLNRNRGNISRCYPAKRLEKNPVTHMQKDPSEGVNGLHLWQSELETFELETGVILNLSRHFDVDTSRDVWPYICDTNEKG